MRFWSAFARIENRVIPQGAIVTILCALMNTGCFVVTSHHVSKPIGPAEAVEFHHPPQGDSYGWYIHHFHSADLDLDTAVPNSAERFTVGFLFWVIPIPYFESGIPNDEVELTLRPTNKTVMVDPWGMEYFPADGVSMGPLRIWREVNGTWKPVPRGQLSITKPESLRLKYQASCNPDYPFKLVITPDFLPGQTNLPVAISYERSKIVRPGIRLPY